MNEEVGVYQDCGKPVLICDVCDHMVSYLEAREGEVCHRCQDQA